MHTFSVIIHMVIKMLNDPFLFNVPFIDVHGLDREYTVMLLKELIEDCLLLREYKLYIIHGKGTHILKNAVHEYLKTDKRVNNYYIYNFNEGVTIIELKK